MTVIELQPTTSGTREFYGILFESTTTHTITGKGVHNPGSQHVIQVWMSTRSRRTDDLARTDEPVYRSCDGEITVRGALTFQTSAQASMIASTPVDRPARGDALKPGDLIDLGVFGTFRLDAKMLHDPILTAI